MERKEPGDGASWSRGCKGEAAVVQRTQVLLLAGEQLDPDGGQEVLSAFARHALSQSSPGGSLSQPGSGSPSPGSGPTAPSGQLIFFLCRAPSLKERPERIREVLRGVREQSRGSPAALVGVIVQPRQEEEKDARKKLEEMLGDTFSDPSVEVHTAVFSPGRPEGALELRRVKHKATKSEMMMKILAVLLILGILACGFYLYNNNNNNQQAA